MRSSVRRSRRRPPRRRDDDLAPRVSRCGSRRRPRARPPPWPASARRVRRGRATCRRRAAGAPRAGAARDRCRPSAGRASCPRVAGAGDRRAQQLRSRTIRAARSATGIGRPAQQPIAARSVRAREIGGRSCSRFHRSPDAGRSMSGGGDARSGADDAGDLFDHRAIGRIGLGVLRAQLRRMDSAAARGIAVMQRAAVRRGRVQTCRPPAARTSTPWRRQIHVARDVGVQSGV